ncbi:hypothetical protein WA1_51230 [Scytonema hofmannii PCC 7110]|uniref:Uncharacterized protein n=1 Tax=Scytonema hofmannii PCC 7110 TaxID=128403 RepID=A0A139WQ68_9CYAN|nr:hypothetical protein [Scytonema hofmannii]KYC34577.1 hypothetical protein WA1_51230 [Scytonema hofmannii PCC 7110]
MIAGGFGVIVCGFEMFGTGALSAWEFEDSCDRPLLLKGIKNNLQVSAAISGHLAPAAPTIGAEYTAMHLKMI